MIVRCNCCNKEFKAKPSEIKRGKKFCSMRCYSKLAKFIPNSGRFKKGHKKQGFSEKNSNWKGEKVGYFALHNWVKRRLEKPDLCTRCRKRKALDLSNKSGEYKRDLKDWEWLCRRCHMEKDGRLKRFLSFRKGSDYGEKTN